MGGALGTGATLTYSFIGFNAASYVSGYGVGEFASASVMSEAQKLRVHDALDLMSVYANIRFVETTETTSSVGDLRFGRTTEPSNVYAHAYGPDDSPEAGDVWISKSSIYFNHPPGLVSGNFNSVYFHEILHAVGLKHPFDGLYTVPDGIDNQTKTIMSYNGGFQSDGMRLLDIEAIQHLYGLNTRYNAGDNTYDKEALHAAFWAGDNNVWDAGGIDEIVGVSFADLTTGQIAFEGQSVFKVMDGVVIENLTAYVEGASLIGNDAANVLRGAYIGELYVGSPYNYFASTIRGRGGNDTIFLEVMPFAPRELTVGQTRNAAYGDAGNDEIFGALFGEDIFGGKGNDRLSGGHGGDYLDGGEGFDRADYSDAGVPGQTLFIDLLQTANNTGHARGDIYVAIEGVVGSDGISSMTDEIWGDNFDNTIWGLGGDDSLNGRGGNDKLLGGDGNDTLRGGTGADRLDGGLGLDAVTYSKAAAGVVASLSNAAINLGEAKGDTYLSLETMVGQVMVENLTGSAFADKLYGNGVANSIRGGSGNDVLRGGGGADSLEGHAGGDTLVGHSGNDILDGGGDTDKLTGGLGKDTLNGGAGADRFIYTALSDSTSASSGRDTIRDFTVGHGDKIDLSALDARSNTAGNQMFKFIAGDGFSKTAGELRFKQDGGKTYVQADVDGNGTSDFIIQFDLTRTFIANDFVL